MFFKNVAKNTYERTSSILMNDKKLASSRQFSEILKTDINEILKNYMDLCNDSYINIEANDNGEVKIKFEVTAKHIKDFYLAK